MLMQKFEVKVELENGDKKKGWVEMEAPECRIQGFRSPIPKAQLKTLRRKIIKNFGPIRSFSVKNTGAA